MVLIIAFAVGLIVFFVVQQMNNKKKEPQPDKLELKRKEALDAILKNNKDRYVG